jgi:hypothetical protein
MVIRSSNKQKINKQHLTDSSAAGPIGLFTIKIKSQIEIPTLNLVVRRKAMQKVLTLHVTNK